jgi:phosphomannomutase/phosphoglucomutase
VSIFKACDVRGRYGTELTRDVAARLGRAVGSELAGRPIAVGGDLRPSTGPLKAALIDGLLASGCRVIDLGTLPTPAFYFAQGRLATAGGVMVTGSHNPPGDNGFKIILGPLPITEAQMAALERRMVHGDFITGTGSYERFDPLARYHDFIVSRFAPFRRALKVVVDCGNGCYWEIAPAVIRELGHHVIPLFCEPDGRFPGRDPNPAVAANLGALRTAVVGTGADLGVAYDGDGDRAVFVDERGRAVESDRSIVLLARHLLRDAPGREVVYDIKCSSAVAEGIRAAGGVPVMEKSGHAFIRTTLLQHGAIMGGEISGHFFFGDLGGDDGLYATLMMLAVVAESTQGLAALADSVPRYPITPDIRLSCPPDAARAVVAELSEAFAGEPGCEVSTMDGVRIAWPDGWALVRPSVTEPLITMRFEAHTEKRLDEIRKTVAGRSKLLTELEMQPARGGPAAGPDED